MVTIGLAPLRAIERARGWRRIGLVVVYALIALAIAAPLRRRTQLAGLPDVGEPFDVAAWRAPHHVSDERNPFVTYRQAVERYREMNEAESSSFSKANSSWKTADKTFRGWVVEHDQAISLLCAGSERPEFMLETPVGVTVQNAIAAQGTMAAKLGWVGTAALFKAARLRGEGDPGGAWKLLRAVIRASRHVEWAVPTAQGRIHGIMMVQYAWQPVDAWAKDRMSLSPCCVRPSMTSMQQRRSPHRSPSIIAGNTLSRSTRSQTRNC